MPLSASCCRSPRGANDDAVDTTAYGVRELQVRKGTPLGMGTAMDGTLYTDPNSNATMPWGTYEASTRSYR